MSRTRAIVIFDGSNFYYKLKHLDIHKLINFNYRGFVGELTKQNQLVSATYCIGEIKLDPANPKNAKMFQGQQKLFGFLQKQGVAIIRGYIMKTGDTYYEKGVDVQIAVELMRGAYKNEYDIAYLISSDTDLLPAIHEAQSMGKTVCYIGFKTQMSYALKNQCQQHRLLTKDDLLPFVS